MKNYGICRSVDEVYAICQRIVADGQPFGIDIETGYHGPPKAKASLHPEENFIVGISITNDPSWARYIPISHDLFAGNLDEVEIAKMLYPVMQTGLGVAHNFKFEMRNMIPWFAYHTNTDGWFPIRSDTLVEAYVLGKWQSIGLKALTKEVFNYSQPSITTLFPGMTRKDEKALRFNELDVTPEVVAYACEDAAWALALHDCNYLEAKANPLYAVEMAVIPILVRMEQHGLSYDWEMMGREHHRTGEFLDVYWQEIMAILTEKCGEPMSINLLSPKQVSDVLFGRLGLRTSVLTKGSEKTERKMSTGAIAMAAMGKNEPVCRKIQEWREVNKLHNTYLGKYEKDFRRPDGRTHPDHIQTAVGSGRFAVSDPPYQQTPKKYHYELDDGSGYDLNFRNLIAASPGHYFLGFDYSQVELRVLAGEAQEPSLIATFEAGGDPHINTAAMMLGKAKDDISDDERSIGKTLNFALLYQMGVKSLAERLKISVEEAQRLYDAYFSAYTSIGVWIDRAVADAKRTGYASTRFGRKIPIWEFHSPQAWIRAKGERLAVNAPIQGAAADYMKVAMVRADAALRKAGLRDVVHMTMNIHDALVFDVAQSVHPSKVVEVLQPAITFPVKGWPRIEADWSMGMRWGNMKNLDVAPSGKVRAIGDVAVREDEPIENEDTGPVEASPGERTAALTALAAATMPEMFPHERYDKGTDDERAADAVENGAIASIAPGHTLIVEIAEMPDVTTYDRFVDLLRDNQGENTVVLRTPEGDVDFPPPGTRLTVADAPRLTLALPGSKVYYATTDVDPGEMAAGMTF